VYVICNHSGIRTLAALIGAEARISTGLIKKEYGRFGHHAKNMAVSTIMLEAAAIRRHYRGTTLLSGDTI
jgi:hypothetical protein